MRFGGGPRLATAVCAEPSLVLRISDAGLMRIARARPDVWQAVAAVVYRQLRGAMQMAADVVALPPRQRIAARLAAYARARRPPAVLSLSQQALAELTGLSRKTVNLVLGDLERLGLVRRDYARIEILDLRGLDRIADS